MSKNHLQSSKNLFHLFIPPLFHFGKNYTIIIEIILFTMSSIKPKLAMAWAGSAYTEGPFGL